LIFDAFSKYIKNSKIEAYFIKYYETTKTLEVLILKAL